MAKSRPSSPRQRHRGEQKTLATRPARVQTILIIIINMKKLPLSVSTLLTILFLLGFVFVSVPSAFAKDPTIHERGWIGGEYKTVTAFPPAFSNPPKSALLVTALNTNTPASLAGLEPGDLIIELNHKPATKVSAFRKTVDRAAAGSLLPLKVWHQGE